MNYYDEIRKALINNEITKRVKDYSKNKSDLDTYYSVGKMLHEAGKQYGERIIMEYSIKLTREFGQGYSERNLRNMRQFYVVTRKWQTVSAELTWSHYCEIIWFNDDKMNYYIKISIEQFLSVRELRKMIKLGEYERLPLDAKTISTDKNRSSISDLIKNPILIKSSIRKEKITEKALQKLILEDVILFMKELGTGYSFVGNEFKIKIGNSYNYIDLLLFNYEYNCFVVVELKVTELKKEHIGQIQVYMNYIDNNLKKPYQDKTIGIIICKKDNKYIIEYSSDPRIVTREYELV